MDVVDPVAYAARMAAEADLDKRIAEIFAAEQKELEQRGEKVCTNSKTCARAIPQNANRCPNCGKNQGQSGSGHLSGANRSRRRNPIVLNPGSTQ